MFYQPIPEKYYQLSEEELDQKLAEAKADLGNRLVILGHHYQRDEVIKFADFTGDSFKLSQLAASRKDADYIVFCGVHFMAESADILSAPHQKVILPDMNAGCHMADMADLDLVEECWEQLMDVCPDEVAPITYMNSAANLKAFCGENGGAVCTSSNTKAILNWSYAQKEKVLFFPDEHLGRNTALKMNLDLSQMIVWDPQKELGGNREAEIAKAKLILWKGYCPVHLLFKPKQVMRMREIFPDIRVIVHPECSMEVVQLSDMDGSTEFIIKTVTEAPSGSKWAVGTELHLVNRLAKNNPDKLVVSLDPNMCLCTTMNRIDAPHLYWALDHLLQGVVVNQITVPEDIAKWARVALDRMLAIK
jgi:quinolinate synthase